MTEPERSKKFESEADEAAYWQAHREEFEAAVADEPAFGVSEVFPDLGPSTERMNIRMPSALVARIKQVASARDVPYQSLIKSVLFDVFFSSRALPGGLDRMSGARGGGRESRRHGSDQHVVPHERGWAVRGEGNVRATSVHDTQQQAIEVARRIARNQRADVVIHRADGSIRERERGLGEAVSP